MPEPLFASILISSYNYEPYLAQAIDSALAQTYPHLEVVVVDDASTDGSREVIGRYGDSVRSLLRDTNLGSTAAYNSALELTRGDAILLLDSDDVLEPTAVAAAIEYFRDPSVTKVHWPVREMTVDGSLNGNRFPDRELLVGDVRDRIVREGPCAVGSPPTSGNMWARRFLERALPVPDDVYCDAYLAGLAGVLGTLARVDEPQTRWRVHARSEYRSTQFDARVSRDLYHYEWCCRGVAHFCEELGIDVDERELVTRSWYHQRALAAREIDQVVPEGSTFLLADGDNWDTGGWIGGRRALPFPERDGVFAGVPGGEEDVRAALRESLAADPSHLVFAWPAFWWLEYLPRFSEEIGKTYRRVLQNDRLLVYDLRQTR
jgi:glycosyltransferase involved in cell wall biosynthesis